ncbi:MAG: hypothetical protein P4L86_03080, partial [Mycobacterium sp.]|nr:hypothetical protein [Mycobacterium sp.]
GTISDAATNAATLTLNSVASTTGVLVDAIPPTVTAIDTVDASPNNLTTEHFAVTFSTAVTGVDASDFTLAHTGTVSGSIATVSGSGTTWTVTVNNVAGDGTLRLDLNNSGDAITDNFGNTLTAAHTGHQSYTIEHTPPTVASIVTAGANPTHASNETFTVTFSESVTGVDSADFTVVNNGTSDTGITVTPVSGSVYTVTVDGVTGAGTLGLDLNASGTGIADSAGNAISGGFTGQTYTVEGSLDGVMMSPSLTVTLDRPGVDPDNGQFTAQNVVGVAGGGSAVEWLDPTGQNHNGYIEFLSATGAVASNVSLSGAGFSQLSSGNSQLAALSNGDVVLTYSGQDGNSYFSVIGPGGVAVDSTLVTSSSTAGQSTQLSNDEFAVTSVVSDSVHQTSTLNIDFYSSLSANLGQAVGTPVQISNAQLIGANPIVGDNAGNFAVIYNSTTDHQAHVAFYADGGSPAATVALGASALAQTVALSDGDFAVLTSDVNYSNFKLQIYTPGGATVGNAVSLPGINGDIYLAADLTPGEQGFTVFSDNNDDGNVYAIRFDNTGNIVAGGTQSSQGVLTSVEHSGSGVEVYNGSGAYFLASADHGQAEGMVNLYLNQSNGAPVLQTFELVAPTVSSVEVPANGTYVAGEALTFTVDFSKNVLVTTGGGTPYIDVTLDTGGTEHAVYVGGSGTSHLTFAYTVATGNGDTNGVAVGTAIHLNGGTISDAGSIAADLTLTNVASTTGVLVDAIPPTVTAIDTVDGSPNNLTTEHFTVTFSKAVHGVDASDFTLVGTGTASGSIATVSGSGTTWAVTVNNVAGDGTLRLDLNNAGDPITDNFGNTLTAAHTGDQSYTIQHTPPAVTSVTVPANATYVAGQNLNFTTTFSEAVTVTGTPRIELNLTTGGTEYATYVSGSGTNTLTYQYTVAPGNQDLTGITTPTGAIDLNGGTIKDAVGNAASGAGLNLTGEPSLAGVDVDAVLPTVSSVDVPINGTYGTSQDLDFSVHFTKVVNVNTAGGTPYVQVTLDTGGVVDAVYLSGSGTSTLTFRYVVVSGELDSNGITVGSSLVLNGATI